MKLALLGTDSDALALVRAAKAAGHAVVWTADAAVSDEFHARLALAEDWEDLLDDATADAVIVGRGDADLGQRSQQVQELVKQGRPVLATFPLAASVLSYFEIDMARGESGSVLRHFNPVLQSAPLALLRDALAGRLDELGEVETIECERSQTDRSRDAVLRHFARDAEMLDAVVGGRDRVGAHGGADRGADDPQAYAGLSVQLSGRDPRPVRWSVRPPHSGPPMQLALVGQQGRLVVQWDDAGQATRATLHVANQDANQEDEQDAPSPIVDPAALAIRELATACAAPPDAERSTWPAALHAMELADTIEISLRRGRMIDVHGQQLTEQLAFRGTMAAAGCGLLLVLVPLLLVVGCLDKVVDVPGAEYWPHALLGLLAAFLAVQVLGKVIYRSEGSSSPGASRADDER